MAELISQTVPTMLIIGAVQGFFLSCLLAFRPSNRLANRVLAVFVALLSCHIGVFYVQETGLYRRIPHVLFTTNSLYFLYGPLLHLYVLLVTSSGVHPRRYAMHLIPFGLYTIGLVPELAATGPEKIAWYESFISDSANEPPFYIALYGVRSLHYLVYLVLALGVLRRYAQRIRDYYSYIDELNLRWLRVLVTVHLFVVVTSLVLFAGHLAGIYYISDANYRIYFVSISLWMYVLGYFAFAQPEVFSGVQLVSSGARNTDRLTSCNLERPAAEDAELQQAPDNADEVAEAAESDGQLSEEAVSPPRSRPDDKPKYAKAGQTLSELTTYFQALRDYMDVGQAFKRPALTLKQVGDDVNISTHKLSQALSMVGQHNFYSFVAHYRVTEAKRLLRDPQEAKLSILEIAYAAGFQSKSNFNKVFKRHTGLTPTEYRQRAD